jgi:hypothetical protein
MPRDHDATSERSLSAIFRSPCGCRYLTPAGELLRSCEDHAPYGGTAFDAGGLLTRIESELGWPPAEDETSPADPPESGPAESSSPTGLRR